MTKPPVHKVQASATQDSTEQSRPKRPVALISLKGEKEFRKVRSHGVAVREALFTLRVTEYRPRFGETWRPRAIIGIVVSKKTLKHAVKRNRARRRVREALRTLPGGLPPCRAILMPNPAVLTVPFPELQTALARALARAPGRVKNAKSGGQSRRGNQSGTGRVTASMNSTVSKEEM